MESESDTDVVITDRNGKILNSSTPPEKFKKYLKPSNSRINRNGQVLEENWKREPYIATVSPIDTGDGKQIGLVYMFQDTASIRTLIPS